MAEEKQQVTSSTMSNYLKMEKAKKEQRMKLAVKPWVDILDNNIENIETAVERRYNKVMKYRTNKDVLAKKRKLKL